MNTLLNPPQNSHIYGRQIALFAAFVLPIYKMLELPSLLAQFAGGDLLLPAFLQFLSQFAVLLGVLYTVSRSDKPLFARLEEQLGKGIYLFYSVYALFFLFVAILPLLDLEKFVYAVFYDTSPTSFAFAFFFFLSAFLCMRGVKTLGRFGDLSLFLFVIPFAVLIIMSVFEADVTSLLPLFERKFGDTMYAIKYTAPHFADVALLLPLLGNMSYQKGDAKKISIGYGVGALCSLLFLAIFYGLFSSVAPRVHYAFAKIAQYFPPLAVVGRIDLIFVYLLCAVLFVYVATPLQYASNFSARLLPIRHKTLISLAINVGAFFFVLFCNKYYNSIYSFFGRYGFIFYTLLGNILPSSLALFFLGGNNKAHKDDTDNAATPIKTTKKEKAHV